MTLRLLMICREVPAVLRSSFLPTCQRQLLKPPEQVHIIRYNRIGRNPRNESFTPRTTIVPTEVQGLIGSSHIDPSKLWKSFVFTIAFSTGSFIGVTIWEYETIRSRAMNALRNKLNLHWFRDRVKVGRQEMTQWQRDVNDWWNRLSPGQRVFVPICALNLLVYGLWRVPVLQPTMVKYFASNPAAKAICWPMVLSTFSHYSFFHIAANMYVLHSFSHAAVASLGREQFLGMYLSACVIASFASHVFKTVMRQPGLSLGASGAIMAVLAYVCSQYPDTQLSILFLPMYTFSAGAAIKVIMGIDLAGVLLGWKIFDHAAHLGGALFGLFWAYYGSYRVWPLREHFVGYWHEMRGPPKK
ncbi:presenilins-associated rhomboid-like protein, mitochondrial [Malaya genurostris]|uniref:presenilins-associated rhomboid-like protein, mitochondrial n=1 Tax=Malaya genurostris TaxID=325434 RepID=UPI0026F3AFD1|nr:presenilins-associated rhomboid-like protein, mitochondrial [Malaya genurostris]XP_058454078.1 presenilins-associated rhomboid-like protein, mitochondrial [Malaya genurostris]